MNHKTTCANVNTCIFIRAVENINILSTMVTVLIKFRPHNMYLDIEIKLIDCNFMNGTSLMTTDKVYRPWFLYNVISMLFVCVLLNFEISTLPAEFYECSTVYFRSWKYIIIIVTSVLQNDRSFTANAGTKVAVLSKGRSSTANSGIKVQFY